MKTQECSGAWLLALAAAVAACHGTQGGAADPSTGASRGSGAERREAPDAARLLAHVAWLADDAQEGRRAGTEAGKRSGEWIAARLAELELEPLGDAGTFLQSFDVPLPAKLGPASGVAMLTHVANEAPLETRLTTRGEVEPLFCSSGGRAQGDLAFRGYGVINAENEWNDYEGERGQVTGRVVLIVRGTPASKAPAAEPIDAHAAVQPGDGWASSGSLFMKVMNAKRHGALAVLVAPHPSQRDEALPEFDHSRAAQAGIPALAVRYEVALRLLPEYEALVAAIDADGANAGHADDTRAPRLAVHADVERGKGPAYNVVARLRGADSSRAVLVGAHYDHLGHGGEGSLSPGTHGEIHNGADDNASGTAAVIEIARLLAAQGKPECDVVFALWSGEELGLLGSEYWAQHPTLELGRVVAKLNLDMVGRAGKGSLAVLGVGSAEPFESWLNEAGPRSGLELELSRSGQGVGGSDHQTFLKRKIPSLHFFSGVHADYHKPSDDVERFEAEGTAKVVALCVELIARIQRAPRLAWVEPPAPQQGGMRIGAPMRVWFGTVPEYSYDGKGLLLSGTSAGSPAEKAGMLAGDVLIQVGDVKVETIQDFMYALQTYKAGDVVLAKFLRDGAEESARVTLATREAH
jgi:hypothetical protein